MGLFSYQAPLLWNQLPVYIQKAHTLSTFKIRLKTFLRKLIVRDGSGDSETFHSYAAIDLDCWGTSDDATLITLLSFTLHVVINLCFFFSADIPGQVLWSWLFPLSCPPQTPASQGRWPLSLSLVLQEV